MLDPTPLSESCQRMRLAPARHRRAIALALFRFGQVDGPAHLGWSSHHDYCRARLGLSWGRYQAYRRCGALLATSPGWNEALRLGEVGWSVVEVAASHAHGIDFDAWLPRLRNCTVVKAREILAEASLPAETPRVEDPPVRVETDGEYVRLRFALPAPVAVYADETLEIARALLGAELPEDQTLAAVVAEASTEIMPTIENHHARRILARHQTQSQRRRPTLPPSSATPSSPRTRDPHRIAASLDRALLRWLDRLRQHDVQLDEFLLQVSEQRLHAQHGLPRLTDFAAAYLDLAPRTTFERVQRARLRRRNDPIACALAAARVSSAQSDLLVRLRRAGIPASALGMWITHAAQHTVRALRRAVAWARTQLGFRAREYLLEGALPPSEEELRTSIRPLEDLIAAPEPPDPSALAQAHFVTRTWTVERDTAELLALLMGSTEETETNRGHSIPRWWPILRILSLARQAWATHVRRSTHPHRRVLARDHWTCAVPDCSRRTNLEVHHIQFRSRGGNDEDSNLVTLCGYHHRRALHGSPSTLRIHGPAHAIRFELGPVQFPSSVTHYAGERKLAGPRHQPGEDSGRALFFA